MTAVDSQPMTEVNANKSKSPRLGPLAGATVKDESELMMTSQKKINQGATSCFSSIEKVRPTKFASMATGSPEQTMIIKEGPGTESRNNGTVKLI